MNKKKCLFGVTEITFLGNKLSAKGVEPDPAKVQALLEMLPPNDKKGVLRALGMVNFLVKFLPNLSAKTTHMWHRYKMTKSLCGLPYMIKNGRG